MYDVDSSIRYLFKQICLKGVRLPYSKDEVLKVLSRGYKSAFGTS